MDVYVVLEGQSVLGASLSREGAEEIAERGSPGAWTAWADGPVHTDWRRQRDDGRFVQRIVCTPIGNTRDGSTNSIDAMRDYLSSSSGARLLDRGLRRGIDWPAPAATWPKKPGDLGQVWQTDHIHHDMAPPSMSGTAFDLIREAIRRRMAIEPKEVRVGTGAAYEHMIAALDRETRLVRRAIPDSLAISERLNGLPVIVDPNMAKDNVRIGEVTFVIGTGENGVPVGTMLRIDEAELRRLTTPRD